MGMLQVPQKRAIIPPAQVDISLIFAPRYEPPSVRTKRKVGNGRSVSAEHDRGQGRLIRPPQPDNVIIATGREYSPIRAEFTAPKTGMAKDDRSSEDIRRAS